MIRKIKLFVILSALMATFAISGCLLLTGTFIIDLKVDGTEVNTGSNFQYFEADLSKEQVWKDHKDNIKYIDNIGFQLWVTNNDASPVTGQLFASALDTIYTDTASVRDNAILILSDLILPAGKTYVDWPTSLKYIRNLPSMRKIVEGGKFKIYGLITTLPFNITIDSATVVVTITAGS
jgi:hypothetical protein